MPNLQLNKVSTLKRNYEFDRIFRRGKSIAGSFLVLYVAKKRLKKKPGRFGFCVSKKNGNAVFRNLIRRRLRDIVHRHRALSEQQWDVIILVKQKIRRATFAQMEKDYQKILHKLHERLLT